MGFWSRLTGKKEEKEKGKHVAIGQRILYPSFSEFGDNIMNDDRVLTVVKRILDAYSKLNPRHIRTVNDRQAKVTDNNINNLLKRPNGLMNKTDFLRRIAFLREKNDNVFIYPEYDLYINTRTKQEKKVYKALHILEPTNVTFYEDDSGTYYVKFKLLNGDTSGMIPYDEVIHWRHNFGENEFMGGDKNGLPNNSALLRHLKLNDKLWQSTFKIVEGSLIINGIIKYGGLINEEEREEAREKFVEQIKNNETGIIAVDSGGDYVPVPFNGKLIDKEILELSEKKIRQHYGVCEAIVDGDYTVTQKEAFYETAIEPGVLSLGEAFTRVLLTPFEISNGNEIIFYTNKIQMMSDESKRAWADILLPIGGVTPNQVLSWIGEPPYEGGDDRYISLNWVRKDIADDYQLEKYKYGDKNNDSNSEQNKEDNSDNKNEDNLKDDESNEDDKKDQKAVNDNE